MRAMNYPKRNEVRTMKDKQKSHYDRFVLNTSKVHWDMVKDSTVCLDLVCSDEIIIIDPETEAISSTNEIRKIQVDNQEINITTWNRKRCNNGS